jgi:hypothetical protein
MATIKKNCLSIREAPKQLTATKIGVTKQKFPKDGRGLQKTNRPLKVCRHPAPHVSRGHPEMELVDPAVAPVPPHNSPDKTQLQTPACSSLSNMI